MNRKKTAKKRVKLNTRGILFLTFVLVALIIIIVTINGISKSIKNSKNPNSNVLESTSETMLTEVTEPSVETTEINSDLFQNLYSTNAVLIDAETGEILKSLNAFDESYPASVTKMMTVLVAIEQCDNLDDTFVMTQDIYDYLFYQDLSVAGFERGEEVTIRDLLYGIMMRSGAECCLGVANYISGSEAQFVTLMNQKAAEMGLEHTHFMNCTGEHYDNHYSSVYDMALILREGLQNPDFREIISTHTYVSNPTNVHPSGISFVSTFDQCLYTYDAGGATMIGAKTGYTSQAGQCLASFAEIDGHEYILVTFGAMLSEGQTSTTVHLHANDAINVYSRLYLYLHNGVPPTATPEPTTPAQAQAQSEDGVYAG